MQVPWDTKEEQLIKHLCLNEIALSIHVDIAPQLLTYYVLCLREEANSVIMPTIFAIAMDTCMESVTWRGPYTEEALIMLKLSYPDAPDHATLIADRGLDARLLSDTPEMHKMVLNLMKESLRKEHSSTETDKRARHVLIKVALLLSYADVIWLYAFQTKLHHSNERTINIPRLATDSDGLLVAKQLSDYLCMQTESMISIKSLFGMTEIRAIHLVRSIIHLFLKSARYEEAAVVYHHVRLKLNIVNPLFYLSSIEMNQPKNYQKFLDYINLAHS